MQNIELIHDKYCNYTAGKTLKGTFDCINALHASRLRVSVLQCYGSDLHQNEKKTCPATMTDRHWLSYCLTATNLLSVYNYKD